MEVDIAQVLQHLYPQTSTPASRTLVGVAREELTRGVHYV